MTISPTAPVAPPIPMLNLHAQYEAIAPQVRAALDEVFRTQQFVLGPQGESLEQEIAAVCGVGHGVGVASGTAALELGLHVCGVGAGDEVVVPSFTFIATGSAVSALGARPVFADIEPGTFNLDPTQLELRLTPRTKAIVAVHLFGLSADMTAILEIAGRRGIPVIEDNAQSLGASEHGRKTGSMGRVGCLSFYPTKTLGGCGDGGMIVTDDAKLATRLRALRNHGQTARYTSTERGWNSRLGELQAAVLRVKLRHWPEWIAARQSHARLYNSLLSGLEGLTVPHVPAGFEHTYSQYTIRLAGHTSGGETASDFVQRRLAERGIASAVYYPIPLHLQPVYAALGGKPGDLRTSERAAWQVLSLPLYPELTQAQIQRVAGAIGDALLDKSAGMVWSAR